MRGNILGDNDSLFREYSLLGNMAEHDCEGGGDGDDGISNGRYKVGVYGENSLGVGLLQVEQCLSRILKNKT